MDNTVMVNIYKDEQRNIKTRNFGNEQSQCIESLLQDRHIIREVEYLSTKVSIFLRICLRTRRYLT